MPDDTVTLTVSRADAKTLDINGDIFTRTTSGHWYIDSVVIPRHITADLLWEARND